jgi:hypothetical protein
VKRRITTGLALLLASGLGYLAMLAWVIAFGGHHRKFIFFMTTVVPIGTLIAAPLGYALLHRWLRLRLLRFAATGLAAGLGLYWLRGSQWNWHPVFAGSPRTALLLIGFPIAGAATFCAVLHHLAPEFDDL